MLRTRTPLVAVLSVALLIALAVAAYGYDTSRDDLIADGVTVAGVDVGGMRADRAEEKIRAALGPGLERPVPVAVAGRRLKLTAERAHLVADVDGMVDAALEVSRDGGLPSRVWRGITGSDVDKQVEPRVTYSQVAVKRFVRRVRRQVNRAPRDADVNFQTASLPAIPSRTGLKLDAKRLRAEVEAALIATGKARRVRGVVEIVQPQVTTAELGKKYPHVVTVDRAGFRLRYFRDLKLAEDLQDRGRPGGARDARGPVPRAEQGGEPCVARAGQRLGRRPGRQGHPRRPRRQPAQVTLAWHLRRGRHPRHRRDQLTRQRRLPRLHPHGGSGCRKSSTTRCRCRRRFTSSSA